MLPICTLGTVASRISPNPTLCSALSTRIRNLDRIGSKCIDSREDMDEHDDIYGDQGGEEDIYGGAEDDIYGDMAAGGGGADDTAAEPAGADIYGDIYGDAPLSSQADPTMEAGQVI